MAATATHSQRKVLTLTERLEVINMSEKLGLSTRKIAEKMGTGRTQIQSVLKRKVEILNDLNNNMNGERKRSKRVTGYEDLNLLIWKWFQGAISCHINVNGPLLKEKALEFAKDLSLDNFKASNGWLESFLKRHNIVIGKMNGERDDASEKIVEAWKERLPGVCEGYLPKDIFNMKETGLFFKDCSRHKFYIKGSDCADGKRSKVRLTVALCASSTGEKMKPLVIGKAKKPLCFGNLDPRSLPVSYWSNTKAWMTSFYFERWLRDFDLQMQRQGRYVLLFLDNCPAHPKIVLNNVKQVFFPPNTRTKVQPMDQGIIQDMKLKYRKAQIQYMIRKMEEDKTATGDTLLASINILDTIYWVNSAWNEVKASTIQKCFYNCGFGNTDAIVVKYENDEEEESNVPLSIVRVAREVYDCSIKELGSLDQNLNTCDSTESDYSIPASSLLYEVKTEDDEEEGEDDDVPAVSFNKASDGLSNFKQFVIARGNNSMLDTVIKLESQMTDICMAHKSKQTKISDFFK